MVPVATATDDGLFSVFNSTGNVHVIVDLVGVYVNHDHDSRYYVKNDVYNKAEITGILNEQELWVAATSTGTHISGSRETSVMAWPSGPTGRYVVTFPRSVEGCGMFVSLNAPGGSATSATVRGYDLTGSPNDVFVYVTNSAGVLTNSAFSVQITCPLSVGLPVSSSE